METILWKKNLTLPLDPDASEIYQWDWTTWLDGETLANPPVIEADAGITATLYFLADRTVDVRIQGGTPGSTYAVTVRATSATHARRQDRTVRFAVADR